MPPILKFVTWLKTGMGIPAAFVESNSFNSSTPIIGNLYNGYDGPPLLSSPVSSEGIVESSLILSPYLLN